MLWSSSLLGKYLAGLTSPSSVILRDTSGNAGGLEISLGIFVTLSFSLGCPRPDH